MEPTQHSFSNLVYLPEPISFTVIDTKGNEFKASTFCHCPEKAKLRQGSKMVSHLRKSNVFSEFDIGRGIAKLIDAKKFHDTLLTLYERGITMYKPTNL